MRLCLYRGLDDEEVPDDATHVIVDNSVTVIKKDAFGSLEDLVSIIMGDSVKKIEKDAFYRCPFLRFVRLSKTLEYIGDHAFYGCGSLEALFLPSTVKEIGNETFMYCESLVLLILPNDISIHLSNIGYDIVGKTAIEQIAQNEGVDYEYDSEDEDGITITHESIRRVKEWLIHHMDEAPFHKLCYDSSITATQINKYLDKNGDDAALHIDKIHGMTPLHMLTMNPHAPADAIAALFNANKEAIFCTNYHEKTPLEYATDHNVCGLIEIVNNLCSHRNSSTSTIVELSDTNRENTSARKRRKV